MVEDNTTPTPLEGWRHQPDCETHACGNEHEHAQAIDNGTRVHHPVPEPPEDPIPLTRGWKN